MPDLNLDPDYFAHPKTKRLVGLLGKGTDVLPIRLWCYCGKYHALDGKLDGYDEQEIERIVGWWGPRGACVAALIKTGFLKKTRRGYAVHGWADRQGHFRIYKDRARNAATIRWKREREKQAGGDAVSTASGTAPAAQYSVAQRSAIGAAPTAADRRKAAVHARLGEAGGNGQ